MKVADVKLFWVKSPSADVDHIEVVVTNNGVTTTTVRSADVEDFMIEVQARGSVSFRIDTYDSEGNKTSSETYTFTLGDLEAPLPATGLGHVVTGVRDVPDAPPA
jgi:hypothetical protein